MASIVERELKGGISYSIVYRIPDPKKEGKKTQVWFLCKNKKEAEYLLPEVEEAEKAGVKYIRPSYHSGNLSPPKQAVRTKSTDNTTVAELLKMYVKTKSAEGWEAGTLRSCRSTIKNYIDPFIGDFLVSDITPKQIQEFYNDLPNHKAVQGNNKKEPEAISARTVEEIRKILRPAFEMATNVIDIIDNNPVRPIKLPKQPKFKRVQWTEKEVVHSLSLCSDKQLNVAIGLMISCFRTGELAGLTWDCVDVSEEAIAANRASVTINKTVRRLEKLSISETRGRSIIYEFPNPSPKATSTVVLKRPKTDASVRSIIIPQSLARQLIEHKAFQEQQIADIGKEYKDYGFNFVFSQLNGRPYEAKEFSKKFKRFLLNHDLRKVDFYSLRHSGATIKLSAGASFKSVQADMGHTSADMLLNVYADTNEDERIKNAITLEERLYSNLPNSNEAEQDGTKNTEL